MAVIVDLHRHDEFSTFDGFGNAVYLAKLAKEYGHTALSTTNHGNTHGLVKTYLACKEVGIKAILGVEAYFLPKYIEQTRGFHLCLFAQNHEGYCNLNRILYEAEETRYYNPIVLFDTLKKYSSGIICTTACVASYFSQMIKNGKTEKAEKALISFKKLFRDNFYIEIQPYIIDSEGTQEIINHTLITLGKKLDIPCVLTSDSHYGAKEDFDTYLKMHEIGKSTYDIVATYGERYMPKRRDLYKRFKKLHAEIYSKEELIRLSNEFEANLDRLEESVCKDMFADIQLQLPKISEADAGEKKTISHLVKQGLIERNKYGAGYIARCKQELEIIKYHGFEDYFLIVADYVKWAKNRGIAVGPGRGSVCNSLVAYALGITDVDSLLFNLDFRRFLRKDKKKYPDIDLDFETDRRNEVIEYLINKYEGHAAQICNYGMYKVDNLINDLAKVCGINPIEKGLELSVKLQREATIKAIKILIKKYVHNDNQRFDLLLSDKKTKEINEENQNIIKHFCKMYDKVRYIGTHAAGVAITGDNILNYTTLKRDKNGKIFTYFDLNDLQAINVLKFDILGLQTMEELKNLRAITGDTPNMDLLVKNKKLIRAFREEKTDGIFQFEKDNAKNILSGIECDCFEDIIATNSMNRPAPLALRVPDQYAYNKQNLSEAKRSKIYEYTKETYGTLVYQEQIQAICVNLANMSWDDAEKIMKMMKEKGEVDEKLKAELQVKFVDGMMQSGFKRDESETVFASIVTYTFNKGHATGYSLIALEEMYFKVYYPTEFWTYKLKMTSDDAQLSNYKKCAVKDDCIVFLPHVNQSSTFSMRYVDDEKVIQEGFLSIKGVGQKAADIIQKYAPYLDRPDFDEKIANLEQEERRCVTKKVISLLEKASSFEFMESTYYRHVMDYNKRLATGKVSFN